MIATFSHWRRLWRSGLLFNQVLLAVFDCSKKGLCQSLPQWGKVAQLAVTDEVSQIQGLIVSFDFNKKTKVSFKVALFFFALNCTNIASPYRRGGSRRLTEWAIPKNRASHPLSREFSQRESLLSPNTKKGSTKLKPLLSSA